MEKKDTMNAILEGQTALVTGASQGIGQAVVSLASRLADYITGTTLFVDGGLLWHYQEQ
jgi:glucose 1-dehydrogenase